MDLLYPSQVAADTTASYFYQLIISHILALHIFSDELTGSVWEVWVDEVFLIYITLGTWSWLYVMPFLASMLGTWCNI